MKNGQKPIYPIQDIKGLQYVDPETIYRLSGGVDLLSGLTKREYFAAMAMQGLISADGALCANGQTRLYLPEGYATRSILIADALLSELNKSETI